MKEKKIDFFKKVLMLSLVVMFSIAWFFLLFRFDIVLNKIFKILKSVRAVIYGIVIAYLFNPIMMKSRCFILKYLNKTKFKFDKKKVSKIISIIFTSVIGIIIVLVICFVIFPNIYNTIVDLLPKLPPQLKQYVELLNNKLNTNKKWQATFSQLLNKLTTSFDDWVSNNMLQKSNDILSYITKSIISIAEFTFDIVIGMIVAIYAFMEKEKFIGQIKKMLYAIFSVKRANAIIDTTRYGHKIFSKFLVGKLIDSLIVGLLCYPILIIMEMPYVLLISVIIGVTNIIPYFGPFIGAIPTSILVFLASPKKSLYFLIFIFILQQIDGNIIGPKILKNTTNISEFWVTFALLLAGGLWGFVGMIIGVPLFAVVYYILKNTIENILKKKNLPQNSASYTNAKNIDEENFNLVYNDVNIK